MKDSLERDAIKAYFRERTKRFDEYHDDLEEFHEVFTELGFTSIDDGCDGFCPECKQITTCAVYRETKEDWDRIYT